MGPTSSKSVRALYPTHRSSSSAPSATRLANATNSNASPPLQSPFPLTCYQLQSPVPPDDPFARGSPLGAAQRPATRATTTSSASLRFAPRRPVPAVRGHRASLPCGCAQLPLRRLQPQPLHRQVHAQGGQLLLAVRDGVAQVAQPGVGLRTERVGHSTVLCRTTHPATCAKGGVASAAERGLRRPADRARGCRCRPATTSRACTCCLRLAARAAPAGLPSSSYKEAAWGSSRNGGRPSLVSKC